MSEQHRITMRYNYYRDRESPLGGGQSTRQVASRFDENPQSGTVQLVSSLGPSKLNEFRFLYITRDISNGVTNPLAPQINVQGIGSYNGNLDGVFQSLESGYQLVDNFTWNVGRHSIKAGFDLLPATFRERTRNLNGTFTFSGLTATPLRDAISPLNQLLNARSGIVDPATGRPYTYTQFSVAEGQEYTESTVVNQGYFIQDELRISAKVKLNLGLRYELFLRPGREGNPAFPDTGIIPQDYNNIAPRLGLAWDPKGDGRTAIRAGYGIYYNTTVAQTFNTFRRGNGIAVQNITVTPDQVGAPAFAESVAPSLSNARSLLSDLFVFEPGFRDPMVHSYFATVERQLLRDQTIAVSYLGNRARALPFSSPTNLAATGTLPDGRTRFDGTANRPNPAFGTIFRTASNGYQNYNGMLVTFTQRTRAGLSFQAGYHYQDVYGLSYVNSSGAFTSFGALTTPSDPSNPSFDLGPGDFSQPHRFTLTAVWDPRLRLQNRFAKAAVNGWSITTRTIAQSGLPFSPTTGQDSNRDLAFNDRPTGIGYNSYRLPTYFELDIRAARDFRIGELGTVQVIGEVFNAPKRLNITNVNRTWGAAPQANASFNTPTSAETARQFQLGLRYTF
ncbi:MAG: hypothetical protein H7039_22970 [Bryobacteraceae bacterium]|nr:hypothetical protein [Bryobacteraceae bacterium]